MGGAIETGSLLNMMLGHADMVPISDIDLLRPFESEMMAAAPCNPLVGNVKNSGPEMLNRAREAARSTASN
jgi:hypothetical protein